ncbi:IacB protein [Verticiella sediminum]|uniref:IacB protein n=1 Tax=Verticiella sediminum TaxID=1247510 RepID=A0A556AW56_9BURK|nr:IacB protein [Verticiella sediminum]TSH97150.1 IacB protein [Verticiella sediminum]
MSDKKPLRVLFCIGIQQNFFDSTSAEAKDVWTAFTAVMKGMGELPGARIIGNMDDDRIMVGASPNYPWTTYVLADMPDYDTVTAACNLFRTTPVGDGTYKMWKYARVEARIGRELEFPA